MTNRLDYPASWASSGTATDPDLDTTHPSYEADRYTQKGWHSEKPPETWQNFLSQITDEKIIERIVEGIPLQDASVTYSEGAVFRVGDKFNQMVGGVAKEILDIRATVYGQLVAAAKKLHDDHLAADNPHNDTVDTLVDGSYIKADVDNFFGSPADPQTIVYHKSRTGPIHGETPLAVGTLPDTGGTFTGDIIFLDEAIVQISPSQSLHYNKATALFELVNGTYALGVDAAGNGFLVGSGGSALVISEASLDQLTIKYNNSFALPVPIVSINIENDLNDAKSVGVWTIDTASDPVFVAGKGYTMANNTATLDGVSITGGHTILVRGAVAAGGRAGFVDVAASADYTSLESLVAKVSTNITHVKQVVIYPTLTTRQKTMLVNS